MSFSRPTLSQIIARIESDIETKLQTGKLLARSFLAIMARAYAGAVHLVYGYIAWAVLQLLPDTAEDEFMRRWANIYSIPLIPATFSTGNVTFTGVDDSIITVGARLKRSDGAFYLTTASGTIVSGTATVAVQAVNAGVSGNTDTGGSLTLVDPMIGVSTAATVAAGGITGGLDVESNDSLRARLLNRLRNPPAGGSKNDYETWAKEVNGVTRAWAYPGQMGAGTVSLTFVMDGLSNIIPTMPKVAEVQNYIDEPMRRPATAEVFVFQPTAVAQNFTIHISPDTPEIRANVEASLRDLLKRTAEPGGTTYISKVREAVSVAAGESDNTITVPSANVTHTFGQIATFGTITWI